jgi:hypothetical protein
MSAVTKAADTSVVCANPLSGIDLAVRPSRCMLGSRRPIEAVINGAFYATSSA